MIFQTIKLSGRAIELERQSTRAQARALPAACASPSQSTALQVLVLAIGTLALPIAWLVPTQLVLPSIGIAALGLAGIMAAVAWTFKVAQSTANVNLWDFAGILALIGFGSSMLSEPQAVVQLFMGRDS
jgi:hypothetical protein